jgi:adenine/guanine phosphoribosyltransferase-like PRPP-binding protein
LNSDDKVLLIDDFLHEGALCWSSRDCEQAGAKVAGAESLSRRGFRTAEI